MLVPRNNNLNNLVFIIIIYSSLKLKLIKNWVFFRTKFNETLLSLDGSDKNYHDIMILYERPTI